MKKTFKVNLTDDFILNSLAIISMFFFTSLCLSYGFPLVSLLILVFFLSYIILRRQQIPGYYNYFKSLQTEIKIGLLLYTFCLASFFIHGLQDYSLDYLIRSTTIKALSFNIYALIFFFEINKNNLDTFFYKFSRFTSISISIIAIASLSRLVLGYRGIIIQTDSAVTDWDLFLSSMVTDNNFFALGILSGVCSIFYLWQRGFSFPKLFLLAMIVSYYYAASRRALIVAIVFSIILIFTSSRTPHKKFNFFKFGKLVLTSVLVFVIWLFGPGIIQKNFSYETKRNFMETFGFNYSNVSDYSSLARYRYLTLIDKDASLERMRQDFYEGQDTLFSIAPNFLSLENIINGTSFKLVKNQRFNDNPGFSVVSDFSPADGGRIERWKFAVAEFLNLNSWQKILGSGGGYHFSFAKKFTAEFGKDIILDYPHNIFLSILLFSGIIGCLAFSIFYLYGIALAKTPNFITLGLFPAAHFFNVFSLDMIWENYHFPFMLIMALKIAEFTINKNSPTKA